MTNRLLRCSLRHRHYALRAFLIALLTAAVIFVPFIIYNGGIFYYYGDFNVQEIPFYQLAHDAVRSGNLGWSHITDLGSDFISSYSFYLLGSPFFWLTIPFPSESIPYLIGPLFILKFACASLTAYLYLQRYVRNKNYAVIGGLLYAFSGFSIYNVFFFHFHEPMIMFPLLLAALDSFLYDKRRGVFAVAVFAACMVNYYFFVGQVLFVVMYYLMLVFTKTYKFKIKEFFILAVEVIIGFAATAFLLLPSALGLMGNPRLSELPEGWGSLVYEQAERYWLIIAAFFFPSDLPAFPVFTPDSNGKWASVAGCLALFGMTGVIAFLQLRERSWIKKLIALLMLFAFVPVLNSAFQLFNSSIFYARWYYMLVLVFTLATIRALESKEADWNRAIVWSAGITAGMAVLIGVMPQLTDEEDGTTSILPGVQATFERFWIYVLIALISLLAFVLILKKFKPNPRRFAFASTAGVLIVAISSSMFIIATGSAYSSTTEAIDEDIINSRDGITIEDIDEVRSDFYECVDNTAMFWQIQSINCFQSSVSPSIMQFYDSMSITRDVASRPSTDSYGLRSFLSCKYLFDYAGDGEQGSENSFINEDGETKMPYWTYLTTQNGFDIYENECYIPMGFTYDTFVTEEEFERTDSLYRSESILYSMVLSKEQMEKYSSITGYTEEKYELLYGDHPEYFDSIVDKYRLDYETYAEVCAERAASSCSSFEYTDTGFTAAFENDPEEKLLDCSVPYSEAYTPPITREAVEIENVNNGFMAVLVPADTDCTIVFTYETPGLSCGIKISLIALGLFLIYLTVVILYRANKKRKAKTQPAHIGKHS
ncbi:MAG: YfhO family protein [Clostridiales bacterium]|nr:YfhO family protein [Clostridiales bacterium]